MSVAPNPMYFACFPLQEYFVNKTTGFPLANGYVEFFSDAAFTVPKDVFQQNLVNNDYTYTNLGSVLKLSGVGTFVDNTNNDIIPFLYPYDAQGKVELYFIRVWSGDPSVQGSVLQFTRQGWPPNLAQGSDPTDIFESSQNLFSNPQFSIVNFTPSITTGKYTITVNGAGSFDIAPGWSLSYAGTGDLSVSQYLFVSDVGSNPSYAIRIESSITVTGIKLTQRLYHSPRVFDNSYLSVALSAACEGLSAEPVTMTYVPSSGSSFTVLSGTTLANASFSILKGVNNQSVLIDNTGNNDSPTSGYVDLVMTVPSGRIMLYTSFLGVSVQNSNSLISNIQTTDAQQTNALFWYYKDKLAYKPIPSYTLGWNWPINPCQELGTTVAAVANNPGFSRYVADETIVFQNTDNAFACTFDSNGMNISNTAGTSFAIIKYFEGNLAREILSTPLCVQLKAGGASTSTPNVIATVGLYYTTDASLPDMNSNNYYSLVSAVDEATGVPTVGNAPGVHGTWVEIPRSNLGTAQVNLKTNAVQTYDFSGWAESDATPSTTATYCAIVIGVSKLAAATPLTFEYCTLNAGYIPTRPPATSFNENLTLLQQYYEKSYDWDVKPATNTFVGSLGFPLSVTDNNNNAVDAWASSFTVNYKVSKRAIPSDVNNTLSLYNPTNSTLGSMYAVVQVAATKYPDNVTVSRFFDANYGKNSTVYISAANNNNIINVGAYNIHNAAWGTVQWVANARLGIV